jgi:predicted metal-dependent phosphoesterase TrpH
VTCGYDPRLTALIYQAMRYDLHCHSTRSDGLLSPADVVRRAAARGVDVLALTDHDETAGLDEARAAAEEAGIAFVTGAELSVSWEDITIHVVALCFHPAHEGLQRGLEQIRSGRDSRARRIADSLAAVGIAGAYEGARRYVTSERLISRTHFARFLVEAGHVREMKDVFSRYLTLGRPGYVAHAWASLGDAIGWIHGAGGQAVLAHPGRYKVGSAGLQRLLGEFRDRGGDAIEVLSPSHQAAQVTQFASLARTYGLAASTGSDYHGPGESWLDLGDLPPLPTWLEPVWQRW